MIRWGGRLILAVIVLTANSAWAAQGRTFEKPKRDHFAYAAMARLEKAGYYTGAPKETFAANNPAKKQFTRYEFAVAIERVYRSIQTRALSTVEPGAIREDISHYLKLLDEFATEIADLGPDVAAMRKELLAQDERLFRQEQSLQANPIVRPAGSGTRTASGSSLTLPRNTFGLRGALQDTLMLDSLPAAPTLRGKTPGVTPNAQGGVATHVGPLNISADVRPNSDLETPDDPAFTDSGDRFNSLFTASVPFGRSLETEFFYSRSSSRFDRFGLLSPQVALGPTDTVGGGVSGLITSRLGFTLQGVRFLDRGAGSSKASSLSGGLSFQWKDYDFALGYERMRMQMLGGSGGFSAYTAGVGRKLSDRARLDLQLRFYGGLGGDSGRGDAGSSSAITSFTVRF